MVIPVAAVQLQAHRNRQGVFGTVPVGAGKLFFQIGYLGAVDDYLLSDRDGDVRAADSSCCRGRIKAKARDLLLWYALFGLLQKGGKKVRNEH
ncbi:MAG: hypothetical protein LBP80_06415 [Treponema sp.]|jgi:hypothetical protein|nr:hypothetical protein [Treponema sp.]